jgi:hypothetical protein
MVKKGGEEENQYIKKPSIKGIVRIIEQGKIVDLTQKPFKSGIFVIGAGNRADEGLTNRQDYATIFPEPQTGRKKPKKEVNRGIQVSSKITK